MSDPKFIIGMRDAFFNALYEIAKQGFEIKEIPIIFRDRYKGYSKIPKIEIFRTLKNLFILVLKKKD